MQRGGELAGVAEALDRVGRGAPVDVALEARLAHAVDAAARGRVHAPARAAERERLAGDDAGVRGAEHHLVLVHHPRHDLRVGVDVGRRHVARHAEHAADGADVAARQPLLLARRELLRVARDAALAAAQRDVHDGRLPGHPRGERADRVDRLVGVPAQSALGRPARRVVLHAVAVEDAHVAVVHPDRDGHVVLALRPAQEGSHRLGEPEHLGALVELGLGDVERVGFRHG